MKELLLTAFEWNEVLDEGIIDYDGFRTGDITVDTKIDREEFEKRAIRCTKLLIKPMKNEQNELVGVK